MGAVDNSSNHANKDAAHPVSVIIPAYMAAAYGNSDKSQCRSLAERSRLVLSFLRTSTSKYYQALASLRVAVSPLANTRLRLAQLDLQFAPRLTQASVGA